MKVILLRDVAKLGYKNDIVEVPNGFGLNKLIPQGLAKEATAENVKAVEAKAAKSDEVTAASALAFSELQAALEGAEVTINAEANEEGRLFQAVKAEAVATAIETVTGKPVVSEQIVMGDPIKQVGEHVVNVASGADSQKVTLTVTAK